MARTPSNMLPLGTTAPDFNLPDVVSGASKSLADIRGEAATLIMFICNHCPFVKHLQTELGQLSEYLDRGVGIAAISANDVTNYPDDSPENMQAFATAHQFQFPYLYDESQAVAKRYDAACTPDFYLFDKNLACIYRGRFDESTPGSDTPVTGKDLKAAIEASLAGEAPIAQQYPSIGCNIKWK
ncbi:Thiol-disulfide oxidoreductase ResA [Thalassocella blandensis]|nr:Thiol-disulfide oxidoreductase ResA [Thalassocella blandensis]